MTATIEGGLKAAETNKKKYGKDYYRQIGKKGGEKSRGGGFGSDIVGEDGLTGYERAKIAGRKGGKAGRGTTKKLNKAIEAGQETNHRWLGKIWGIK